MQTRWQSNKLAQAHFRRCDELRREIARLTSMLSAFEKTRDELKAELDVTRGDGLTALQARYDLRQQIIRCMKHLNGLVSRCTRARLKLHRLEAEYQTNCF